MEGFPTCRFPAAPLLRIGVIGAGSLGGTVNRLWVQAGHEVLFSSRHPEELVSITRPLGPRASAGTAHEAAAFGTVLLFAVPYLFHADPQPDHRWPLFGAESGDIDRPARGVEAFGAMLRRDHPPDETVILVNTVIQSLASDPAACRW